MKNPNARHWSARRAIAALLVACAISGAHVASPMAWSVGNGVDAGEPVHRVATAWRNTALADASGASLPSDALVWKFDAPKSAGDNGWTAERGRLTSSEGQARLQPDTSRRVVLVSPPGLPDAARYAEEFVLGVPSEAGLQRVRIQARRDARGGWITIADASGAALQTTVAGIVIKRKAGARTLPIERLRIELHFRTTNPRALTRIAAIPGPR